MLLIDSWNCKIDDKYNEDEKVKRSYFNIERDKRENVVNDNFDFEIIFVHDINFLDIVIDVINKVIDEDKIIIEDFFACFVRTCSWSLMLLKYLTKQRLHENVSIFSFAIRAFLICCCNWRWRVCSIYCCCFARRVTSIFVMRTS